MTELEQIEEIVENNEKYNSLLFLLQRISRMILLLARMVDRIPMTFSNEAETDSMKLERRKGTVNVR